MSLRIKLRTRRRKRLRHLRDARHRALVNVFRETLRRHQRQIVDNISIDSGFVDSLIRAHATFDDVSSSERAPQDS